MFGIKKLTKSRDEFKALAYTLEAELNAAKEDRNRLEAELDRWREEVDYMQREMDHSREKLHLAMRALQSERERDNIMKHILNMDLTKQPKTLFVTPSAEGKIVPPQDPAQ